MPRFVTHLESAMDGTHLDANQLQTLHAGRPLWVKYDLPAIASAVDRDVFATRESSMFRYRELLPVGDVIEPVSLGEGNSPLLPCPRLGKQMGLENLYIKDESQLPTGSFKSRGLSMAVTMAKHFGVEKLAIPTAGNAGGATAAYAARAGMQAYVLMPADTPIVNMMECVWAGAHVYLVDGLINDCGRLLKQGVEPIGWFDLSTLKEPYRIEGKKTMGLELAQQFHWKLPDVILYPTGGGTGLIGMWKAFNELRELGWLDSTNMPRMVSVQSDGCCPISNAFDAGERFAEPFANASTAASGLRVPVAVGDFMILDAVRESGGLALAAPESKLEGWQYQSTQAEGISVCPETAACIGALERLVQDDWIKPDENVVVFNTGAAQKYVSMNVPDLPRLDAQSEIDWRKLIG
ncbi:MAG: threonine synthase [Pirellulaceae bacterium]|nr:threonine synthase [Pirellulaceae bacterium]